MALAEDAELIVRSDVAAALSRIPSLSPPVALAPRAGGRTRTPRWLQLVDAIHSALPSKAAVAADAVVLGAAGVAAEVPLPTVVFVTVALVVAFNAARVYACRTPLETQGLLWYPSRVASPFAIVFLVAAASATTLDTSASRILGFACYAGLCLLALRALTWSVVSGFRRNGVGMRRTLVVGGGEMARKVVSKLEAFPEAGLAPVGILSPDGRRDPGAGVGTGALPADLPAMIKHRQIAHVVLVPEGNDDVDVAACLEMCDGLDVSFSMLPPLADLFLSPRLLTQVGGLPLIALGRVARTRRVLPGKRILDIAGSVALLVLATPVLIITALAVKIGDGGPLFFAQERVGQGGRVFRMLKFRSMVVGADRMGIDLRDGNITDGLLFKMKDDPRVTAVGRVIRKFSLDELPQLWNVLRGDMSLVGPRPLPVDPEDFGALDGKRHSVPPGITGYWQVAGGTGLSYQEMVKLDLSYIQNWSIWLDIRLLLRTVPALATRHRHGAC